MQLAKFALLGAQCTSNNNSSACKPDTPPTAMLSEACQDYMQHVDSVATHSGSLEDAMSLLQAAQDIIEKQVHPVLCSIYLTPTYTSRATLRPFCGNLALIRDQEQSRALVEINQLSLDA